MHVEAAKLQSITAHQHCRSNVPLLRAITDDGDDKIEINVEIHKPITHANLLKLPNFAICILH